MNMLAFSLVRLLSTLCFSMRSTFALHCTNAFGCASAQIDSSALNAISGPTICQGYFSCYNSSIRVPDKLNAPVLCNGAFGCYQASSIAQAGDNESKLQCSGLFSCANVKNIDLSRGTVSCNGEQSCSSSNIHMSSKNSDVECHGSKSCSLTTVSNFDTFQARGALASQGATLSSVEHATSHFHFSGAESALDTEITCMHECAVHCESATGCNGLKIVCAPGTDCSITSTMCDSALKSDFCKEGLQLPAPFKMPSLQHINASTLQNSQKVCDAETTRNCDDYQDFSCVLYRATHSGSPVCCSGEESCNPPDDYINPYLENIVDLDNFVAFRADGANAAAAASSIGPINAPGGGDMYFAGSKSVNNDSKDIKYKNDVFGNKKNHIYATGSYAFQQSNAYMVGTIYCLAYHSCSSATMSHVFGHIYGYGSNSLDSAKITNVAGDIYCGGYLACQMFEASNIEMNVIGAGYRVMYESKITNVAGAVVGVGNQVLAGADIVNVEKVTVAGVESLLSAKLRGVIRLEVNGTNAMNDALVLSDGLEGNKMSLVIDGDNSAEFYIICNETDTCSISCKSRQACTLMNLECFGSCHVSCGKKGVECPRSTGNAWVSVGGVESNVGAQRRVLATMTDFNLTSEADLADESTKEKDNGYPPIWVVALALNIPLCIFPGTVLLFGIGVLMRKKYLDAYH